MMFGSFLEQPYVGFRQSFMACIGDPDWSAPRGSFGLQSWTYRRNVVAAGEVMAPQDLRDAANETLNHAVRRVAGSPGAVE